MPTARPSARRLPAAALLLAAGLGLASPAAATEPFTPEQKAAIESMVRDYILQNPDVILEAVAIMQARDRADKDRALQAALVEQRSTLERTAGDPVLGNPKGDVTIVEFFDYQCGYCKTMTQPLMDLLKSDGNVRLVLKEFPILGPESLTAARASLAAHRQGKYEAFHLALLGLRGRLTEPAIWQVGAEVGLDLDRLKKDMADPAIEAQLQANYELAQALQIEGTPAFTIGKNLVPGAAPKERLAALVKQAREGG